MKSKNIKKEIEEEIKPFLEKLKIEKYVKGIVLLGGLGERNFLDKYSDIDLSIFVDKKDKKKFLLPFEFYYPLFGEEREFNIHQQIIEDEEKAKNWDPEKIEAYSRGKIIYDPEKKIKKLIDKKTKFDKNAAFKKLVWINQQYLWRARIHSIRAFKRGYPETANYLLNNCLDLLLEAIYILNERNMPHPKWKLIYLEEMGKKYQKLIKPIKKAMVIKNNSLRQINKRIRELDKVFEVINKESINSYKNFPKNPYEFYYKNYVQLNKKTKIDSIYQKIIKKKNYNLNKKQLYGQICFNLGKYEDL